MFFYTDTRKQREIGLIMVYFPNTDITKIGVATPANRGTCEVPPVDISNCKSDTQYVNEYCNYQLCTQLSPKASRLPLMYSEKSKGVGWVGLENKLE